MFRLIRRTVVCVRMLSTLDKVRFELGVENSVSEMELVLCCVRSTPEVGKDEESTQPTVFNPTTFKPTTKSGWNSQRPKTMQSNKDNTGLFRLLYLKTKSEDYHTVCVHYVAVSCFLSQIVKQKSKTK